MPELINWKAAFLKELEISPNVRRAARASGIGRRTAYDARESDPEFKAAWDDAIAGAVDDVEEEGFKRARIESDVLTIFLLKCHRPERYADKKQETEVIVRRVDRDIDGGVVPTPSRPEPAT